MRRAGNGEGTDGCPPAPLATHKPRRTRAASRNQRAPFITYYLLEGERKRERRETPGSWEAPKGTTPGQQAI